MKNPTLHCLGLLVLVTAAIDASAQKYKGVNVVNRKSNVYKTKRTWQHEIQFGVKFPNAQQGKAYPRWLSGENLYDYFRNITMCSLAYYVSPSDRVSLGLELYYDKYKYDIIFNSSSPLLFQEVRHQGSLLAQVKYYWRQESSDRVFRLYSMLGAGWGADFSRYVRTVAVTGGAVQYNPSGRNLENNFQYQAVLFGMVYGQRKMRVIGELGYGSMYLVKAGLNYAL